MCEHPCCFYFALIPPPLYPPVVWVQLQAAHPWCSSPLARSCANIVAVGRRVQGKRKWQQHGCSFQPVGSYAKARQLPAVPMLQLHRCGGRKGGEKCQQYRQLLSGPGQLLIAQGQCGYRHRQSPLAIWAWSNSSAPRSSPQAVDCWLLPWCNISMAAHNFIPKTQATFLPLSSRDATHPEGIGEESNFSLLPTHQKEHIPSAPGWCSLWSATACLGSLCLSLCLRSF